MLSVTFFSSLVALALLPLSVSAASSLSLRISGPKDIETAENLKVTAIITNTGLDTVKVLNDPRGPLSKLPANIFSITDAQGAEPSFIGVKVKYAPQTAAKLGAYTTLAPGQVIEIDHNLSEAYNFTSSGAGVYDIQTNNIFHVVNDDSTVETVYADVTDSYSARVSGNLVRAPSASGFQKRATYVGCTAARQTALVAAAASAETYAGGAYSYVTSHTSTTPRYSFWFGTYTTARHSTVVSTFSAINSYTFSTFTWDCTCTDSGAYAYVYPNAFGRIYLCGAFWNAPNTGTDSKAGTIIEMSAYFVSTITSDVPGACGVGGVSPTTNAACYEYFAENTPPLA